MGHKNPDHELMCIMEQFNQPTVGLYGVQETAVTHCCLLVRLETSHFSNFAVQ